ncbi:hypothetical protein GQ600_10772 [Phytophthora cactorum]|nr:hypothetical protein GQ600_10772 [Phytophthora cactorum]
MALRARTTKRARPQTSPSAKHVSCDDVYFRQPGLVENQHDDKPRRKRAMVSANLRFLEKMPPLRDYQRGRFGRRGGVDGGAPHATDEGSSLWMRALEESMEETSFVTREAPTLRRWWLLCLFPNLGFSKVQQRRRGRDPETTALRPQAARGGGKDDEARPARKAWPYSSGFFCALIP